MRIIELTTEEFCELEASLYPAQRFVVDVEGVKVFTLHPDATFGFVVNRELIR